MSTLHAVEVKTILIILILMEELWESGSILMAVWSLVPTILVHLQTSLQDLLIHIMFVLVALVLLLGHLECIDVMFLMEQLDLMSVPVLILLLHLQVCDLFDKPGILNLTERKLQYFKIEQKSCYKQWKSK